MKNVTYPVAHLIADAATVVLADVVSIEAAEPDVDLVVLHPVVTFIGGVPIGPDGTFAFRRSADVPRYWERGYWAFDADGAPATSPDADLGSPLMPFPMITTDHAVFTTFPDSVPASDVLANAPIVVAGRPPGWGSEADPVDGVLRLRLAEVLRGDVPAAAGDVIEIDVADRSIRSGQTRDLVWLLEPGEEGRFRLVDTWIAAPWPWDFPVLGDAIRSVFPDAVPFGSSPP